MGQRIDAKSLEEVPTCKEPLLFRKHLTWNILQWDVPRWRDLFALGANKMPKTFRQGPFACSKEPIWERKCSLVQMEMDEFFGYFTKETPNSGGWLYFDYKHVADHLTPDMASKLDFTWEAVGFPEKSAKDSTIWMGTAGSHTPCHIDTYGCNFVAQIHGKKRWLLFPPSETCNLKPTRVPYEESSIYSSYNFYRGCAPFPDVNEAIMVDLEPGDVLYVPKGWWHYVENLTSAISVNIWIPQESDDFSRLKECLVKYLIRSTLDEAAQALGAQLLNPNEDDLPAIPRAQIVTELRWCLDNLSPGKPSQPNQPSLELDHLLKSHSLSRTPIAEIRTHQNVSHQCGMPSDSASTDLTELDLVKAFSHPDVVSLALEKFLELNKPSLK